MSDAALVSRAQAGDELAFRRLLERHRPLIRAIAREQFGKGLGSEDYEQEAMIGFLKAVRDYRGDRESSFRNFASICVRRQAITALRTASRDKHRPLNFAASLDAPLPTDPEATLGDILADRRASGIDPAAWAELRAELGELADAMRERLTELECGCVLMWAEGLSYEEIAQLLCTNEKAIDNALQRAHRKLAEADRPKPGRHQTRSYGYRCPTCGGATVKLQRRGRPPRCVVCRSQDARSMAVAA